MKTNLPEPYLSTDLPEPYPYPKLCIVSLYPWCPSPGPLTEWPRYFRCTSEWAMLATFLSTLFMVGWREGGKFFDSFWEFLFACLQWSYDFPAPVMNKCCLSPEETRNWFPGQPILWIPFLTLLWLEPSFLLTRLGFRFYLCFIRSSFALTELLLILSIT